MKKTFEVRIWEKAMRWYFDTTVDAIDERAARTAIAREYSPKKYSINDIREKQRAA